MRNDKCHLKNGKMTCNTAFIPFSCLKIYFNILKVNKVKHFSSAAELQVEKCLKKVVYEVWDACILICINFHEVVWIFYNTKTRFVFYFKL
ncbi:hypothetical protein RhiirA5_435450 [Rhizophagus irregularis]|uniref:Uncharacterized protein n=1 Tax=Rhizophagus irregularis TaxID=588596 RepID=A0A2N0NNE6_9GLOM|nr:hypothetical protein RhiirA5_435450 [Rhizophagus irregularis]